MKTPNLRRRMQAGFALVLSLVLMGFLVILLLSLTTMVSIDVQNASHSQKLSEARQNALLALSVAIGELQRATGPDQRTTALAELQYDGAPNAKWVGAYAHAMTPDYELGPEAIATEWTDTELVDDQGSAAKLLTWLVSGNSSATDWPDFRSTGELSDPSASPEQSFLPNAAISNLTATSEPSARDIKIQDATGAAQPARILVGSGSVESVEDFVVAPLVELEGESGGFKGGFAWWVGDENTKARANLGIEQDPDHAIDSFANASRSAIELMARNDTPADLDTPTIDNLYNRDLGERALSKDDLIILSPNRLDYATVQKRRFHDISLHSTTLLTDSFAGGLKRDLSKLLDPSHVESANDPTNNANRMWTPHANDITGYGIPTWRHLRSFLNTRADNSGSVEATLPIFDDDTQTDHVGVTPVLTYFSMGFGFSAEGPLSGSKINLNLYPLVVLWNPYNVTLKAPPTDSRGANFEVGMLLGGDSRISVDVFDPGKHSYQNAQGETIEQDYLWRTLGTVDLQRSIEQIVVGSNNQDTEFIRFGLNCPDIPPGQSLIFSLPYSHRGDDYDQYPVLENIEPEPDSYMSVTAAILDKDFEPLTLFRAGPRYSLSYLGDPITNLSKTLLKGGDGGLFTYLGKPTNGAVVIEIDGSSKELDPANPEHDWYQTIQSITWDNAKVQTMPNDTVLSPVTKGGQSDVHVFGGNNSEDISAIQAPMSLNADPTISYVIMAHALFSGDGNNAQFNQDQFMFPTRWIAQGNMRAPRSGRTRRDNNFLPLYIATAGSLGDSSAWQKFANDQGSNSNRTSAGSGHDWSSSGPVDAVLFEFFPEGQPLLSIGQLQHANLSLIGAYPSYPIGNSLADYRLHEKSNTGQTLAPSEYALARTDSVNSNKHLKADQQAYYDISYLLNRTLWDAYFVSSVPQTGNLPARLPNPRMQHTGNEQRLRDADTAAAEMILQGGFNINSTSEQAWRAVLGGVNGLKYNPETGAFGIQPSDNTPMPRFTHPTSGDDVDDPWQGYRSLTNEEIAQLAHNIVIEIKNRGPFVSLAEFVNRRLVDNPDTDDSEVLDAPYEYEDLRGVIQAAIDRTWSSSDPDSAGDTNAVFPINDADDDFWMSDELTGHPNYTTSSQFKGGGKYAYDLRRISGGDKERKPYSNRSAFSPKYLTQADVLSTIGASLTARSDTFTIRAYGEVASELDPSDVVGVWCEAVVQRTIDYMDETDNPEDAPSTSVNQQFGRRYKLISFQWLKDDEI
ncbi:pilus assembly PilX family protein [Cerasicoccus fimbriatus]|uniref:pilus assembly PilX family protein n=1 Tax=Cerasicoccus fimbriatus TaxID=3014554 RepID=UPI0022B31DCE|nr:hypothetical protein [Cerasicoccus sp. TK19100]